MKSRIKQIEVRKVDNIATLPARIEAEVRNDVLVEHVNDIGIHLQRKARVVTEFDVVTYRKVGLGKRRRSSLVAASGQDHLLDIININERGNSRSALRYSKNLEVC